jgi:hypothetical protein
MVALAAAYPPAAEAEPEPEVPEVATLIATAE